MRVITKKAYKYMDKALQNETYQSPFPAKVRCGSCHKSGCLPMMVINDDEGLVHSNRPRDVGIWPHDCLSMTIYLCTNCGHAMVEWNQA